MAEQLTGAAVAKRLASCNKAARGRALRLLRGWLPSSPSVTDDELLKIWKGLFYCMWHADKAPAQSDLSLRLSSLLLLLHPSQLAPRYLSSFLSTLRREWSGIDHHRLDKFYALLRAFVRHLFAFLARQSWDPTVSAAMLAVLSQNSLLAADTHPALGVSYHISQVFLDEIQDFLPLPPPTLAVLLEPFFAVVSSSPNKTLVSKVRTNVFQRLLLNACKYLNFLKSSTDAIDGEVEKLGKIGLAFGFSKRFFDLASAEGTVQSNRKLLFELHQSFSKIERDLERSGMEISLEAAENGNSGNFDYGGDTMAVENGVHDSEERPSKKRRKKDKKGSSSELDHVVDGNSASKDSSTMVMAANGSPGEDGNLLEDGNFITFDEIVISNLQKQFEKVAEEDGMVTPAVSTKVKKRKRVKSADGKGSSRSKSAMPDGENRFSFKNGKSAEKSASVKRVRFSMKNNLIWKPQSPLPPHSLRLPPSATPRGSALKQGVPPGPVKEATPPKKVKVKAKVSSAKKVRRSPKSPSSGIKRLRKLQNSV